MSQSRKWEVKYRTPSGGTFTRLWPARYGKDAATARKNLSTPQMLRAVGSNAGFDAKRSESLRVVSVKRSQY